ncbi:MULTISPECIES: hypothetical protein [unclassified Cytobacillus]|uniref:hypothetical protein n=1 Tax=unclassified Cytobacillus TaxID=2675268 RepID=UPI001358FD4F|nr:hypothetical protein [Cytobacillus sp. AMY 15.2]KAF0817866.1 hypothetical protein KIS4809_3384 [Bacillus sp. ZZV12-4809]MCM3089955.1 hypothetical protein [Cytobacillus sp. AMY 15.2]
MYKKREMPKSYQTGNPQIKEDKIYMGNSIKGAGYKKKRSGNGDCGCGSNVKKLRAKKA